MTQPSPPPPIEDLMRPSLEMRASLRAYLETRRGQVPLTSDGSFERGQLDRWIAWLKGAI